MNAQNDRGVSDTVKPAGKSWIAVFLPRLVLVCFITLLAGSILFSYVTNGEPLSASLIQQLRPGMTESEVIGILGRPSSRSPNFPKGGCNYLCYTRPLKWNVNLVLFGTDGLFSGTVLNE
jgi:outer membrane protein assembly factor BamE (lipoprotein component of BamABCDE complex)